MVTNAPTPPDGGEIALAPAKRAPGRPLVPISPDDVRTLARRGLTVDQVADRLNVSRRTMYARMASDSALRDAMDAGVSEGIDFAAGKLMDMIADGNLTATIFYLRSRAKWRSSDDTVNINIRQAIGTPPGIDDHVMRMAAAHTALLNGPDPDIVDADWTEVIEDAPPPAPAPAPAPAVQDVESTDAGRGS
jgi:hypothetical protein